MISALMGFAFIVGLGLITAGWFLRFFGIACLLTGSVFTLVQIATSDHDAGGYAAFAITMLFGLGFWIGGHLWHYRVRGYFRTHFGKSVCVAAAYGLDLVMRRGPFAPAHRARA